MKGNIEKKIINFKKNVLQYITEIFEDERRFNNYFKKRFPKSFKYLPIVKLLGFLLILVTLKMDYQTYSVLSSPTPEKSLALDPIKSCSQYSFFFYLITIMYEFIISVYVTLKAKSPVRHIVLQIAKNTVKVAVSTTVMGVGYAHAPVEPNVVSNLVHTKTPFGRGFDYEIGSLGLKAKGDIVSCSLGNEDMMDAVQKHSPDNKIIDINKLNNIINDPEYNPKIRGNTTIIEKSLLGMPVIKIPFLLPTSAENPVIQDLNVLESSDIDNDEEEHDTPVIKRSSIRRINSEPLLRKTNKSVIQRRNTR